MARFCPLFSGSSGNCTYIGNAEGGILIDAGVSAKGITNALSDIDVDMSTIKAIFVTHEHSDHISGIRVLASRHKIPVYASMGTSEGLVAYNALDGKFDNFIIDSAVEAAGMVISHFETSHDSKESNGYMIAVGERKIAVCTDLGYVSDDVRHALTGCDLVMLESNHDIMMLQNGRYPYYLKRRVLGNRGHLSNNSCANELSDLVRSGTTRIVLAHLSRENNMPELALQTAKSSLQADGIKEGTDYIIAAAPPSGGKMIIL